MIPIQKMKKMLAFKHYRRVGRRPTPGPWESTNDIDGSEVIFDTKTSTYIARVFTDKQERPVAGGRTPTWDEGLANSAMIVASPILFRELENLRDIVAGLAPQEYNKAIERADDAITAAIFGPPHRHPKTTTPPPPPTDTRERPA